MNADIGERCVSVAESLEGDSRLVEFVDNHQDREGDEFIEAMEHRYTISERGTVREVEAIVATGGPHIVVECLSGVVAGSWGGDSHRCHVDSDQVEAYGARLADRMERRID